MRVEKLFSSGQTFSLGRRDHNEGCLICGNGRDGGRVGAENGLQVITCKVESISP